MSRVFSRNLIPRYTLVGDRYYICFYTCPFKDGKNWYICVYALPKWTGGKEPTCRCRKHKRYRFVPWIGKIPGGGNGKSFQFLHREFPWTEEPGGLQSVGSQSQTWLKQLNMHACMYIFIVYTYLFVSV